MKKLLIAFSLLLVIIVGILILTSKKSDTSSSDTSPSDTSTSDTSDKSKVHYYTEDYAEKYKNELHEIFGDYTIGLQLDMYFPEEKCDCGYHADGVSYKTWEINYKDVNGHELSCIMTNREDIFDQQYSWLESQIVEYFRYSYVEEYYGKFQQEDDKKWNHIACNVGDIFRAERNYEAYKKQAEVCDAYRESLKKKQDLIPLSSMKYSEMFDSFPITVKIRLDKVQNIDGEVPQSEWLSFMSEKRDYVADQIVSREGKNVNVQFRVFSVEEDDFSTCIVKGEKKGPMADGYFETEVYSAYKGVYW